MLLYTLQGIPMGLSGSVPFLMQAKGISMTEQAKFSIVSWPFSLKLLWAPLVDSLYSGKVGRRKTWIVPAQMSIGFLLLFAGSHIDGWLGEGGAVPDVDTLTQLFLVFYFLAATQDIAVDGLALTILSPRNKELGATCNGIGQSLGYFLAYTGFLAFNSAEFCNSYLRAAADAAPTGYISLGGFMVFWAYVFMASTLWVAVAKGDEHTPLVGDMTSILTTAYREMYVVLRLPAIRSLALVLLTCRAALGVFTAVTPLRLVEAGVPKEKLALLSSVLPFVGISAQMYVSARYLSGGQASQPLLIWLSCYLPRLLFGMLGLGLVVSVPGYVAPDGSLPTWLYGVMLLLAIGGVIASETQFVAQMAFYNRVADPAIGGTYMTMLNTLANMGGAWPNTAALFLVGTTTYKVCEPRPCNGAPIEPGGPLGAVRKLLALGQSAKGGECGCDERVVIDGYVVTCLVSMVVGLVWYGAMKARVCALQRKPASEWAAPPHACGRA